MRTHEKRPEAPVELDAMCLLRRSEVGTGEQVVIEVARERGGRFGSRRRRAM
jgi:hypothetical protein